MCMSLTRYLSVADNARDAVFIHVSASNEKQEWRNETAALTKTTKLHNVAYSNACGPTVLWFYALEHLVVQVTQYNTHKHVNNTIL